MSYEWITPKTDWTTTTRFEYTDYNRIRNNLLFINDMLNELYPDKAQILDLGVAKTDYDNDYTASEFTAFEDALESFTRIGQNANIGDRNYYRGNDSFIWADALNRLEECCLRWYNLDPIVVGATLSPASFELQVGETQQLTLTVEPIEADYTEEWISSNNSFTVSNTGLVTCVNSNQSNATITVNVLQHGVIKATATCQASFCIPVTSIEWFPQSGEFTGTDGVTKYSDIIITPSNATHKNDWYIEPTRSSEYNNTVLSNSAGRLKIEYKRETEVSPKYYNDTATFRQSDDAFLKYYFRICVNEKNGIVKSPEYYVTCWRNGSYETNINSMIAFRLLKCTSSAAHLIYRSPVKVGYFDNYDDRAMTYRSSEEGSWGLGWLTLTEFSDELLNALKSFTKVVPTGRTTTASYSAKIHLPAMNEIDTVPTVSGGTYQSLGTDTYPLAINGYAIEGLFVLRSRLVYTSDGDHCVIYNDGSSIGDIPVNSHRVECAPIINISPTIRVNYLNEDIFSVKYYSIDWTNTSTTKISDIPLGSILVDLDGSRRTFFTQYA